jgi:hypothetical protein
VRLQRPFRAGASYFAQVFAFAFVTGVVRTLWLTPAWGATQAVIVEVPFILTFSWVVARRVARRHALRTNLARAKAGAFAFIILMGAELALAKLLNDQSPAQWASSLVVVPGVIGLAGQIGFAVMPMVVGRWLQFRRHNI